MNHEIIKLTKNMAVFSADTPISIGTESDLEIALPKDVTLDSFTIKGMITECRHVRNNETSSYLFKMNITELTEKNRLILDAYVDFLEREKILDKIRKDNQELQNALSKLGDKLMQLIAVSELLIREAQGKVVMH
ncbi:hypothetical protein PITCH_A1800014 [uncultured Desulfobacterium sp.]|uniref:PilZ domain-containing protein n=1 Tax=uncultured Desulfobacterium sp. TaxID=201089 RepID=A0A445MV41_9BACT|nr:hypothetical protein PITCH_A1800014 [uncultured Desulfobacterium sp.]